jgi:FkbM family methyltransferase
MSMHGLAPFPYPSNGTVRPALSDGTWVLHPYSWGGTFWTQRGNQLWDRTHVAKSPYQITNNRAFKSWLPASPRTIVDVGLNIGLMAWQYARWGAQVVGFEPTPRTMAHAACNLVLNGVAARVTLYEAAVMDRCGTAWLRDQHDTCAVNQLVARPRDRPGRKSTLLSVRTVPLDALGLRDVDGIKVDTEGAEYRVLLGARRTIEACRPVVQAELLAGQMSRFGDAPEDAMRWFAGRDYLAFDNRGRPLPMPAGWETIRGLKGRGDVFFVPRERASKRAAEFPAAPSSRGRAHASRGLPSRARRQ